MRRLIPLLLAFVTYESSAGCEIDATDFVGWSIVYSGTITGYIDEEGEKKDDFQGCQYGRKLIVDYTKAITCTTYSYHYAYHPDVAILKNGNQIKACIDDEMYDVQ
jgi:hypothetical protein